MQKKQLRKFIGYLYSRLEHVAGAVELIDEVAELIEQEISDDEGQTESDQKSGEFPIPKEVLENDSLCCFLRWRLSWKPRAWRLGSNGTKCGRRGSLYG